MRANGNMTSAAARIRALLLQPHRDGWNDEGNRVHVQEKTRERARPNDGGNGQGGRKRKQRDDAAREVRESTREMRKQSGEAWLEELAQTSEWKYAAAAHSV